MKYKLFVQIENDNGQVYPCIIRKGICKANNLDDAFNEVTQLYGLVGGVELSGIQRFIH